MPRNDTSRSEAPGRSSIGLGTGKTSDADRGGGARHFGGAVEPDGSRSGDRLDASHTDRRSQPAPRTSPSSGTPEATLSRIGPAGWATSSLLDRDRSRFDRTMSSPVCCRSTCRGDRAGQARTARPSDMATWQATWWAGHCAGVEGAAHGSRRGTPAIRSWALGTAVYFVPSPSNRPEVRPMNRPAIDPWRRLPEDEQPPPSRWASRHPHGSMLPVVVNAEPGRHRIARGRCHPGRAS